MIAVQRRADAPMSLSSTQAYDGEDVRDALESDFKEKCYLCEGPTGGTFNIEHFRPKAEARGFPVLRQTWSNLFPAHGQSCNQRRIKWHAASRPAGRAAPIEIDGTPRNWPEGGMLDCAAPGACVEWRLMQWADFGSVAGGRVYFEPRRTADPEAENTAVELRHIHGDADDPERHSRTLRERITARYCDIQRRLNPLMRAYFVQGPAHPDTREQLCEVVALLATDTPYAGVLRGTLRRELRRDGLPNEFISALGLDIREPPAPPPPVATTTPVE